MTVFEEIMGRLSELPGGVPAGKLPGDFPHTVLDVIDERLAAMAARIAERDQQLARLRREMDALREGLRSAHDPELIAHDVMVAAKAVAP